MAEPIDSGAVETRIGFNYTGQQEFNKWDRALDKAERRKKVEAELGADFDDRQFDAFDRALTNAEAKAKRRGAYQASLGGDFDARAFNASERALAKWERDAAQAERASGRLGRTNRDLDGGLLSLSSRLPLVKWGTYAAGAAAAVPPTLALAGALGPITGLLGAIPGLATAAGGALVSGMLGLRGVGDALGASWDQQTELAAGTADTAKQAETATDAIRAAEERLADSHRRVTDAQEDLTDAREDARRRLVDLRLEAQRANLSEKEAVLALREAQKEALEADADWESSATDRARAQLRVRDAELALKETRVEGTRAQRDYREAERSGVRGMDEVVDARERLSDAEREVRQATDDVGRAARDAKEQMATAAGGSDKLAESMADLSPAGRAFVQLIEGRFFPLFRRLRDEAQEGLLPGLGRGLVEAERSFPVLERMVGGYSDALGDAAEAHGELFGSRAQARDFEQIFGQGERLIRRSAAASLDWSRGLTHVAVAAEPILDWLGKINVRLGDTFERWAQGGRESGRLEAFFERSTRKVETTVEALWDFSRGLINIGTIGARVWGDDMLRGIGGAAKRFRDWTESVRGSRDIEGYFIRWRRRWGDISGAMGRVVRRYRELRGEGEKPLDASVKALAEAWSRALPVIAENVARQAPEIVEAFIKGFLAADSWGKLAIGGWLLAKFGGAAAFLAVGRRLGGFLTGGLTAGLASGAGAGAAGGALSGLLGKLGPIARRVGFVGIGLGVINGITRAFSSDAAQRLSGGGRVQEFFSGLTGGLVPSAMEASKKARDAARRIFRGGMSEEALGDLIWSTNDLSASEKDLISRLVHIRNRADKVFGKGVVLRASVRDGDFKRIEESWKFLKANITDSVKTIRLTSEVAFKRIANSMELQSEGGQRAVTKNFRIAVRAIERELREGNVTTRGSMRSIRSLLATHSKAGGDAVGKNFGAVERFIRRTMRNSEGLTRKGAKAIRGLLADELQAYGIDKAEALRIVKLGGTRDDSFREAGHARGGRVRQAVRRATGGFIGGPGQAGHDTVHMAVPQDSSIVNRHQLPWLDAALHATGLGGVAGLLDRSMGGGSAGPMVPIVAGAGELHLDPGQTRLADTAMRVAGGGGLDALFAAINRPHYLARGGYVQGAVPPGGVAARQLAEEMFAKGFNVTSAYRSTSTTHHGSGNALDFGDSVNSMPAVWGALFPRRSQLAELFGPEYLPGAPAYRYGTPGGAVAGHEDHIHVAILSALKGALGSGAAAAGAAAPAVVRQLKRLAVRGPDSAIKRITQRALDTMRAGAQRRLEDAVGAAGIPGGSGPVGPGIATRAQMVRWATESLHRTGHGASPAAIEKILALARKESSWEKNSINLWDSNAAAGNPSGGLMHVTLDKVGGTIGGGLSASDKAKLWDPIRNMMASIRYQFGRYGGLITHSPYAKGGRVGGFAGGGRPGSVWKKKTGPPARGSRGYANKIGQQINKTLSGFNRNWGLDAVQTKLTNLEDDYSYEERRYEVKTGVDEFVVPAVIDENTGAVVEPPRIDMEALADKARSLQRLVRIREEMQRVIETARRAVKAMIGNLRDAVKRLKGARRGKHRGAYDALIEKYQGEIGGLGTSDKDLVKMLRLAKLDVTEVSDELAGLWGGTNTSLAEAVAGLPESESDPGDPGGGEAGEAGDDPNAQAVIAQLEQRLASITAERDTAFSNFSALSGPGDIGQGYDSAYAAAAGGAPGYGVQGGGSPVAAAVGAAAPQAPQVVVQSYSLVPGSPAELLRVGEAAAGGFSHMAYRSSSRESTGL